MGVDVLVGVGWPGRSVAVGVAVGVSVNVTTVSVPIAPHV